MIIYNFLKSYKKEFKKEYLGKPDINHEKVMGLYIKKGQIKGLFRRLN